VSLALLTDLYELTMAYGYWRVGKARQQSVFHLYFRNEPFGGAYAIAAGLEPAIEYLRTLRFTTSDLDYLASTKLFPDDFLRFLGDLRFTCEVDAIPEGTVVFAMEPLVRVRGSILEAQIIETALLNFINFQTLIATKAQRIVWAAEGNPVIDFGLRRAQGKDGALAATRAAFIGGVGSTSNVLAGAVYGIPVKGTHAHSWVMSFDSELEAFEKWAEVMPEASLFLVDTYDTLQGVEHAIAVGKQLRSRGYELAGIRLDSGELAPLSIEARKMLDAAGFESAVIAASNELDEHAIVELKRAGAQIHLWGIGTRLITAFDQPALGGVYKLSAIQDDRGEWQGRVKRASHKQSIPGMLQVRRSADGDVIYDELRGASKAKGDELLVPIFRDGQLVYDPPALVDASAHREREFARFPENMKRFDDPERWHVTIE
jgi:nicotinate phosphoribosyltransferase